MKSTTIFLSMLLLVLRLYAQQQLNITRIQEMPDMPSPYEMRDWKHVAEQYDSLIFSLTSQGTHLPLMSLGTEGVNYPEIKPIFLDSYVGSSSNEKQREAINIIPAIVGASLVGIDKKTQFGIDWVDKVKDFYNLKNGELVYLNGPSDQTGNDWWYETMPNIFFYQLYDLYPNAPDFDTQFRSVADRWLEAVIVMGGKAAPWQVPQMNYRAWNLKTMQPLAGGVTEPEAAGAIGWILYQAYQELGDKKYLTGAQWCMEYLSGLESNPSYELQLPYGVLAAAKMNAEIGTNYNIAKLLSWCFERGDLRGWGSIVGNWDGTDVSGLIGEANDQGNDYAFIMNGFQLAAAVVPMVKYDKRFATAVAKWVLNVSNASRLFYRDFIPSDHQSDYEWSATYDPQSVIAYESIKETWQGKTLFSRGDAKDAGWANTNFGLYGSSHVGYLGAIVETTEVDGILKLNANVTDFFGENTFPTYLIYNPHSETKQITLEVGNASKDLYDAISETMLLENVSGSTNLNIPAKETLLISYVPSGAALENAVGKLLVSSQVLDYHYAYDFTAKLRIKALSATSSLAEVGIQDTIYSTVDYDNPVDYEWIVDGQVQAATTDFLVWTPSDAGLARIKVTARSGAETTADSLEREVVDFIALDPIVDSIYTNSLWHYPNEEIWIIMQADDPKNLELSYDWTFSAEQILSSNGDSLQIKLPSSAGVYPISYTLTNSFDKSISGTFEVLVVEEIADQSPLIYLPLNGHVQDRSGNGFATLLQGTSYAPDPKKQERQSLSFTIPSDELRIPNSPELNFTEAITVSFWLYLAEQSEERFVVSHGGWEQRWKASVTPTGHVRWTVNTKTGIKDLDSTFPIAKFEWVHLTMSYSGKSMQLYVNGVMNSFSAHTGAINPSNIDLTVGKRRPGDDQYYLKGRVDEIKIFNTTIDPKQAENLQTEWLADRSLIAETDQHPITLFPNPTTRYAYLHSTQPLDEVYLIDLTGRKMTIKAEKDSELQYVLDLEECGAGIYTLIYLQNGTSKTQRIFRQ